MQNAWIWIVVVIVVVVGGFLWWQGSQSSATGVDLQPGETAISPTPTPSPADTSTGTSTLPAGSDTSSAPMSVTVTYGAGGFSPAQVTVKKGGTVTWKQEGGSSMWVASAPHPAHTGYNGDSSSRTTHCSPGYDGPKPFDQCAPGASYSFVFDSAAGTFAYHDHMDATNFGKVTVVE